MNMIRLFTTINIGIYIIAAIHYVIANNISAAIGFASAAVYAIDAFSRMDAHGKD